MKSERAGDIYAFACAVICGLGNIPAKAALLNLTPELFNFYYFVAAFIISALALIGKKERLEVFSTDRKSLGLILFLTLIFSVGIYTQMKAVKMIEPATVSFMSRLEMVYVMILAYIFLKERLGRLEIIGGIIAIGGIMVLKLSAGVEISNAATLMLVSTFFFGVAEILTKKNVDKVGTMRFVFIRNLGAVVIFYLLLLYRGQAFILPDSKTLLLIFIAALLLPILGRITYLQALSRINISRASLITQATPLFTALFALIFLGTVPTPMEWLGGALILMGVGLVRLSGIKIPFPGPKAIVKSPM